MRITSGMDILKSSFARLPAPPMCCQVKRHRLPMWLKSPQCFPIKLLVMHTNLLLACLEYFYTSRLSVLKKNKEGNKGYVISIFFYNFDPAVP